MDFTKTEMVTPETSLNMSMGAFLASLGLEQLREVFDREQVSPRVAINIESSDITICKAYTKPKLYSRSSQ